MIKIIIADDHQIVRDGIKSMLASDVELQIIADVSDGDELLGKLPDLSPDIILMDISMPGKSGIEVCKKIHENYGEIRIIMLSMYTNEEFVLQALRAGASGYLPKNISRNELIHSIQLVYKGEQYISEELSSIWMKNMLAKVRETSRNQLDLLSKREIEILRLCAEGFTNSEICEKLFISIRTVESHKTHIMQKLEIKSIAELIRFAIKNDLTTL